MSEKTCGNCAVINNTVCKSCYNMDHWLDSRGDACPTCFRSIHVCDCKDEWNSGVASTEEAIKQTAGKAQWSLLSFTALEGIVKIREFGSKKYRDPESWKHVPKQKYLDASMRHLVAIFKGEEIDKESGLPHIDHLLCNAMFISHIDKESKK